MTPHDVIGRLVGHMAWADIELGRALERAPRPDALREFAHVVGAEEVWLSRIEGRRSALAVWPELSLADARSYATASAEGFHRVLAESAGDESLQRLIAYTNSAGRAFE